MANLDCSQLEEDTDDANTRRFFIRVPEMPRQRRPCLSCLRLLQASAQGGQSRAT